MVDKVKEVIPYYLVCELFTESNNRGSKC